MHSLTFATGVVCVATWLYLLLFRGGFWMVQRLAASSTSHASFKRRIAVVIPARNEAQHIGAAVSSLLRQACYESLHVFVVDDHSSDGTAGIARQAAVRAGYPGMITVVSGGELPRGWTGKLWALHQGVEQALQETPDYLLLTDADIQHGPGNVTTLVSVAERGGYDLTSFMVKLNCQSVAERLLIPPFVFFFFLLYPPRWVADARRSTAGAAGGCMLLRPETLARIGGIATIRSEIIDDCALARAIKRSGGKVWLGVTEDTFSLRSYGTFTEIAMMIARTAFNQLRHSPWILAGALAGLILTYVVPLALIFSGSLVFALLGAITYLMMTLSYLAMVRFYRLNPTWALTLPAAAAFYMMATLRSALNYWSGHGGQWKGRSQDA